jgi:hypothetical protein
MRKTSLVAAVAAVTVGCLGLTACGGDDDTGKTSDAAPAAPSTGKGSDASASASASARPEPVDPAKFPVTAAGTTLKFGESAVVPVEIGGEPEGRAGNVQIKMVSLETGGMQQLKDSGIKVTPEQEQYTPVYLRFTVRNVSAEDLGDMESPSIALRGHDNAGGRRTSATIFGTFPLCDDNDYRGEFPSGAQYDSCEVFLLEPGRTLTSVTMDFADVPPWSDDQRITWKP